MASNGIKTLALVAAGGLAAYLMLRGLPERREERPPVIYQPPSTTGQQPGLWFEWEPGGELVVRGGYQF